MQMFPPSTPLDLSGCDKEPIHLVDSVQPHGALLTLSEPELEVLQASENAQSILQCRQSEVVGQHVQSLFSDASVASIRQILSSPAGHDIFSAAPCAITVTDSPVCLQGLIHRYNGVCLLELEPQVAPDVADLVVLQHWITVDFPKFFRSQNMADLLEQAAAEVQKMCGFDRVLVYRFDRDWNGSVVAECKRDFMPTFLNHRFPAADIPAQARALYTKKMLRNLVDVDAVPSALTPKLNPLTGKSLDLTYSTLRSMSPIHIEYLRNMGVAASMSISLLVENKLWGLIACHHKTARAVDFATRSKCELVAQVVAGSIEKNQDHELTKGQLRVATEIDTVVVRLSKGENLIQSLRTLLPDLCSLIHASGIALIGDDIHELYGITPVPEVARRLVSWLRDTVKQPIFCTDRLSVDFSQWRDIATQVGGLLAIDISTTRPLWILWFRCEQIEELLWAGNPHKPAVIELSQGTIQPRKSFQLWIEKTHGHCRAWEYFELEGASCLQTHIFRLMLAEIFRSKKISKILGQQREDVLAILTHDLKVPVVAIDRVLAPMLANENGRMPADVVETLRVLQSTNSKQRERIFKLSQVLNYELGRLAIESAEIDCGQTINDAIAEVSLLPESGAKIVTNIDQSNSIFRSDRESIVCLVVNLVANAVRAAGTTGTVEVICDCSCTGLSIEVKDDGPGIALDDQAQIFERFWQGGARRTYAPHVGMGLYFCKRIVDTLDGTISCASEPGKGTTFTVFIPSS